jgi:serine/threonine-protein kinase HipA
MKKSEAVDIFLHGSKVGRLAITPDHARNFSFILENDQWILSPAYDLVPSNGFNGQHTTTIAGQGNPDKSDIFKIAENTGLTLKVCLQIFDEVYEGCHNIRKINL